MEVRKLKTVLVGPVGVGKTSISSSFVSNKFDLRCSSTLGAAYSQKQHTYENGRKIIYQIWDTAGQERYKAIAKIYYKDAKAAVCVFDVTSENSLQLLKDWIEEVKSNAPEDIVLAIVGNKYDLILQEKEEFTVSTMNEAVIQDAEAYAKKNGAIFRLVSAKQGLNITLLFDQVASRFDYVSRNQPNSKKPSKELINANLKKKKKCQC